MVFPGMNWMMCELWSIEKDSIINPSPPLEIPEWINPSTPEDDSDFDDNKQEACERCGKWESFCNYHCHECFHELKDESKLHPLKKNGIFQLKYTQQIFHQCSLKDKGRTDDNCHLKPNTMIYMHTQKKLCRN